MHKKRLIFLLLLLNIFSPAITYARDINVVFLNPGHPSNNVTGNFWSNVTLFMEAASNDLDINLVTIYAHRNHVLMKSLAQQVIEQKPEYVILVNEKGIALNIFKEIAAHNIPVFMLLNTLSNDEYDLLSQKEKKLFIGSVTPDNYRVGRKLGDDLINEYLERYNHNDSYRTINFLALLGDHTTPAATERARGLTDALKVHKNIILVDSTVENWSEKQAYQKVKGMLQRRRIDIIWTANDAMAFGAKQAVLETELAYEPIIGGVNWDLSTKGNVIDISYGGHVTLGAYAISMLKDIDERKISSTEKHQMIDIFESSRSHHFSLFKTLLSTQQLSLYDFTRFNQNSPNKMKFSIENMLKTLN
jgi:ABC-type sugar transport system substrate-binding protein